MKRIAVICVLFRVSCVGLAQDIHFSQFNENPALINPALTGAYSSLRTSITNRDQWRSVAGPYKTIGASADVRLKADGWRKMKGGSMAAAGISFYRDKAANGLMGQSQINVSFADHVSLNEKNVLSVGLQGSLVQRVTETSKMLFPGQYNGKIYDPGQASGESFANTRFTYFDVGAGGTWTYSRVHKNMEAYKQFTSHLGFSAYHLSRPRQEYLAVFSRMYVRYVLHGDLLASIDQTELALAPSFLMQMQGPSTEMAGGVTLRKYIKTESKYTGMVLRDCMGYGLYYRSNDAIMFSMLYERQEKLALIFSYDVNVSKLRTASSFRGGVELTLRYTTPKHSHYRKEKE